MTGPTERATEVVVTINSGEADLNRGKLAVTIHLLTYLTERIHGYASLTRLAALRGISPSHPPTSRSCKMT